MASSEDILLQFTADDNISSVVENMEATITASVESMVASIDGLDASLGNIESTVSSLSSVFGEIEQSVSSAEGTIDSFSFAIDNVDSGSLSGVQSDVSDLANEFINANSEVDALADNIANVDGMSVDVDVNSSGFDAGDYEVSGEVPDDSNGQNTSALATSMYDDFLSVSDSLRSIGQDAVETANSAEQGWLRFGNAVTRVGGSWDAQEESIKSWVKTFSNSMGRSVADTRSAMTTFMSMGMSLEDTQKTMQVVSNYASQFGISQEQASKMIQMAFMGAGRSIKKLGLNIKDFKDEAGNVDKEKLLQAIMERTAGASERYANTYEARVQRMNNAIASIKTDFGREIINTVEPLIPVIRTLLTGFIQLPQPIKSVMLGFAGLAGGIAIVSAPLIKFRAYTRMAGIDIGTLRNDLKMLQVGFQGLSNGGIKQAIDSMKTFRETSSKGEDLSKVANVGKNTGKVTKEAEQVIGESSKIGGMSGTANASGAGMKSTSVGLRSIGQGALSMVAPLLEIALAVAILMPILALLAVEALLLLKGIQLVIDALNFDDVDLKPAIESIKDIGQALFEMGVAMGAMTFANLMTGLAIFTSGITLLFNPISIAGQMLIKASDELKVFNTVSIDESVPENLKRISTSLNAVSVAMSSLTSVVINMAMGNVATLGGLLGNVSTAISTAKKELVEASSQINQFNSLSNIDDGAIQKLKKVSDSLKSLATAMDSLRSLRDDFNWDASMGNIFKGVDIQSALRSVKDDIVKASVSINQFKGIANIDDGIANKLKKVADSLKSIGDSMKTLRTLRDDYNWDNFMNIFRGVDIPGVIRNVKSDLFKVANSLRSLNDISNIPEGTGNKIHRVTWTVNNVLTAIQSLKNLQANVGEVNLGKIPNIISKSIRSIRTVANRLRTLNSVVIPEGLGGKIQRVTWSVNNVSRTARSLNSVPPVNQSTSQKVRKAVNVVRNVAKQLKRLQGTNVSGGIGQALNQVRTAVTKLRTTLNAMRGGFRASGMNIGSSIKSGVSAGLGGLSGTVSSRVSSAVGGAIGTASSGGTRIGSTMTNAFRNSFKISKVASDEVNYAIQAIRNGTSPFVQAVREMARQAVATAKAEMDQQSPGKIARMFGAEMDFSTMMVRTRGSNLIKATGDIAGKVVSAWGNNNYLTTGIEDNLNYDRMNSLRNMVGGSDMGKNQRPVSIVVSEGAIQLDARNLTTKESKQIMINAIEGLDFVEGIDLRGV